MELRRPDGVEFRRIRANNGEVYVIRVNHFGIVDPLDKVSIEHFSTEFRCAVETHIHWTRVFDALAHIDTKSGRFQVRGLTLYSGARIAAVGLRDSGGPDYEPHCPTFATGVYAIINPVTKAPYLEVVGAHEWVNSARSIDDARRFHQYGTKPLHTLD